MYYGVQYYPEHWPEERWATDFEMMAQAGVDTIRMGEFAWSAYEPEEGRLDFGWMQRALEGAHAQGIRTIMCTCSRTPPPWVFARYPSVRNHDEQGRPVPVDARYTIGLAHPEFQKLGRRIDQAVIDHFAGHPAITGWQVDNEVGSGNDCYCPVCQEAFRDWLKERFGSTDALHAAVGEHFWSFHVERFDEIQPPAANPQLRLLYRRFLSQLNVDFVSERAEMIRAAVPDTFVTTNFQSGGTMHSDYAETVKPLDMPGMNHYPARSPAFVLDLHRGVADQVLILEQFTRLGDVDAGPGWMRLWAWLAIAHGAKGISFFRWRPSRWGREQFGDGLLPHSGEANERYRQLQRMGQELRELDGRLDEATPDAQVAVLHGYPCRWALHSYSYGVPKAINHFRSGVAYHQALLDQNIQADVVPPAADLSKYRLVIAPSLFSLTQAEAANLCSYVEGGGHLCLTVGSGVVDEFGKSFDTPRPGPLAELAGVTVDEVLEIAETIPVRAGATLLGQAVGAADHLEAQGAEVLATFGSGWRKGMPAVTRNAFGGGTCTYVAAALDEQATAACAAALCEQAGVAPCIETPDGVTGYQLSDSEQRFLLLLNHTDAEQAVSLPAGQGTWCDAWSGEAQSTVSVPPVDLRLLVRG